MTFKVCGKTYKLNRSELTKVAEAAFSVLGDNQGEIELLLVSPDKIQSLNNKYRNKDSVTDVLSFEISASPLVGQIFICYTIAREHASEAGIGLKAEVEKLLIHGIAHLFGFDHENDRDEKEMRKLERIIWEKIK